jgi:hypothetical protein
MIFIDSAILLIGDKKKSRKIGEKFTEKQVRNMLRVI